jgi:phage terminase small subunit
VKRKSKPAKAKRAGLNPKQARFVAEYLKDLNGKQAAIRAGYSPKTAESQASRLLSHAKVSDAVAAGQAKTAEKLEVTKEMIADELRKIAFADMRKVVAWGPKQREFVDADGQRVVSNGVKLIDSSELDPDTAAAVAEVANTREGVKIKLHDKKGALVDLAKLLGYTVDKVEHSGEVKTQAPALVVHVTGTG